MDRTATYIQAWPDDDTDNETVNVALGTTPEFDDADSGIVTLTPNTSPVVVTITDDDGQGADPNDVITGPGVEVSATELGVSVGAAPPTP